MQEQCIDQTEDGDVRTDAESECENGYGCETRTLPQDAPAVAQIQIERFEQISAAGVAALFLDLLYAPKFPRSRTPRLLRGHSRSDVFLDLALQVKAHFVAQFPLKNLLSKERAKTVNKAFKLAHGATPLYCLQNEANCGRQTLPVRFLRLKIFSSGPC